MFPGLVTELITSTIRSNSDNGRDSLETHRTLVIYLKLSEVSYTQHCLDVMKETVCAQVKWEGLTPSKENQN